MPKLSSPLVWSVDLAAASSVGLRKTQFGSLGMVSVSLCADFFARWSSAANTGEMAALETKGHLAALDLDDGAQPIEIPLQRDSIRMIFAP